MADAGCDLTMREYGSSGPWVVVLHGGPGAMGYMAPVARGLADAFRVLEPWQRGSGDEPLTVARHVDDLHALVTARCGGERPALVGHSWGAMLALAYAAAHPLGARAVILVGCGTFDPLSRDHLRVALEERLDSSLRDRLARLESEIPDPDRRLEVMGNLILPLYSYDLITSEQELATCDARAHDETWDDMVRQQDRGIYPAAFSTIDVPVLMLHGVDDPHPGRMIRTSLQPYVPHLEYHEWHNCGHYPWLEREVCDDFFAVLHRWLAWRMEQGSAGDG